MSVKELCRKHAFSDAAFYGWCEVRETAGQLGRNGCAENAKLKKLLAGRIWMSKPLKVCLRETR